MRKYWRLHLFVSNAHLSDEDALQKKLVPLTVEQQHSLAQDSEEQEEAIPWSWRSICLAAAQSQSDPADKPQCACLRVDHWSLEVTLPSLPLSKHGMHFSCAPPEPRTIQGKEM